AQPSVPSCCRDRPPAKRGGRGYRCMRAVRQGRDVRPREIALGRGLGRRAALGGLLACALLTLVLPGCASLTSSAAPFAAAELSRNPTLIVATTRKPVNAARARPWFGTERASALTFARGKLVPPDDGQCGGPLGAEPGPGT